jgi:23S rRNA (pseudouridine1915-N3)-methyltransferase
MLQVRIICAGKMKERFFSDAFSEYAKRLSGLCRFDCTELPETKLPENPSIKEIDAALKKEAAEIAKNIPKDAYTIAMCVEGRQLKSEELAALLSERAMSGRPAVCFIIGSSYGLDAGLKQKCDMRLSMSEMTFPHHLARVMLAEQIYRGFKINEGSKYHK